MITSQFTRTFTPDRIHITVAGEPFAIAAPGQCKWTRWEQEDPYTGRMAAGKEAMGISAAADQSPDAIAALESAFNQGQRVELKIERDRDRPGAVEVYSAWGRVTSLEMGMDEVRFTITRTH